jgi:hypothetical protein
MNGAESLVRTLIASGVEVCFANPGTSEIHFVAALDKTSGMRAILCLFEGVATGAAGRRRRINGGSPYGANFMPDLSLNSLERSASGSGISGWGPALRLVELIVDGGPD